jgi:CRP/FNR family transcriptional regulator, cyclic AMP receptor protein
MPTSQLFRSAPVETLKQVPLFSKCSNRELRKLAAVMTELHVDAGRVLTAEGQPGLEFFVVMTGNASIWQHGALLETVGPGSFFGEVSLLDRGKQTATVVSQTDMRLLVLTRPEFTSASFFIAPVMERMLVVMGERFRRAEQAWGQRIQTTLEAAGRGREAGREPSLATDPTVCSPSLSEVALERAVG